MAFRYDKQDNLLIAYTGDDHDISDYRQLLQEWLAYCETSERFGVILVNEPHEHHHDEDHERDGEREAEFSRMMSDFRRDHRATANAKTVGFAVVYPGDQEWLTSGLAKDPDFWKNLNEQTAMRHNYMFGTRGAAFKDIESAKEWIKQVTHEPPVTIDKATPDQVPGSQKVGLFFGSTTGVTEDVAYDIQEAWKVAGAGDLTPVNIGTVKDLSALLEYDYLILGASTWNIGELQDDWDIAFPQIADLDFTGKTIALFGIGDQYGYPDNYLDALGILGDAFIEQGATLIGYWSTEGYEFSESRGARDGQFMGLAIDDMNQDDLTSERVQAWVAQIIQEFNINVSA